jgi:hypothetical protein
MVFATRPGFFLYICYIGAFISASVAGSACGPYQRGVRYDVFSEDLLIPPAPARLRVMVARFADTRPDEEKSGEGKAKGWPATKDEIYRDVLAGITKATADHIRLSGLFSDVHLAPFSSEEISADRLDGIQGTADAVLVGSVAHFYGIVYRRGGLMSSGAGAAAGAGGGAIGGLFVAGILMSVESAIPKEIEAHAALADVKLISTTTGDSMWEGSAEEYFKRTVKGIPEEATIASEALKGAVTKLIHQLYESTSPYRQ